MTKIKIKIKIWINIKIKIQIQIKVKIKIQLKFKTKINPEAKIKNPMSGCKRCSMFLLQDGFRGRKH